MAHHTHDMVQDLHRQSRQPRHGCWLVGGEWWVVVVVGWLSRIVCSVAMAETGKMVEVVE